VVVILQTVSTNGRYIGLSLIVTAFPTSTMGLIFVPKMLAVRNEEIGGQKAPTRGSRQGLNVTGLQLPEAEREPQQRLSANTGRTSSSEPLAGSSTMLPLSIPPSRVQTVTFE
jgi:hypothetical protein